MGRIISQKEASLISKEERKKGRRVVFTNGCFDIIHKGHIELLKQAKDRGDILIVGLNSDSSTKKIKGKERPIIDEESRAVILSSTIYVDYVVIFNEKTPYNLIRVIRPDTLVKGEDWKEEEIVGKDVAREVVRVKLVPGYSTTEMVKKIMSSFQFPISNKMPNDKCKKYDLEERTARFGEAIIEFAKKVPQTPITISLITQMVKAGTSVGANYCEADCAESKKDFEHKIGVCKKESKETKHWIRMIVKAVSGLKGEAREYWKEANELTLIFSSIINKSRKKKG